MNKEREEVRGNTERRDKNDGEKKEGETGKNASRDRKEERGSQRSERKELREVKRPAFFSTDPHAARPGFKEKSMELPPAATNMLSTHLYVE